MDWAVMFPDLETDLGDLHHNDQISLVLVLSPFLPAAFRGPGVYIRVIFFRGL